MATAALLGASAIFLAGCASGGERTSRRQTGGGSGMVVSPRQVQIYQRSLPRCPYTPVSSFEVDVRTDPRQRAISLGAHAIIDFQQHYAVDARNRTYVAGYSGLYIRFHNRDCMH